MTSAISAGGNAQEHPQIGPWDERKVANGTILVPRQERHKITLSAPAHAVASPCGLM